MLEGKHKSQERAIHVSVEEEAADNLGMDVGSTLEFAVQGTPLAAIVESTRKVDWGSFSMNFFMILSPGRAGRGADDLHCHGESRS